MLLNRDTIIRRCIFRPYRKGMGPVFTLTMWDTGRCVPGGPQQQLGYRLTMTGTLHWSWSGAVGANAFEASFEVFAPHERRVVLFEGEDYGCSPMDCIDSDASVVGLMHFLTLRPGDTDAEYFDNYTPEQMAFSEEHGEALRCEVDRRFCDEDGNVKGGR